MSEKLTAKQYNGVHLWLHLKHGSASVCEGVNCERKSKLFQWALISGKKHEKNRENYIQLCIFCHKKYDKENKNTGHKIEERKVVFIDEETHANIKAAAKKNNRSMAKQLKHDYLKP